MSEKETRPQFYGRMEVLAETSALFHDRITEVEGALLMGMRDAAAAGYLCALRELHAHCDGLTLHDQYGSVPDTFDTMIRDFAAARGLDLEEATS